MDNKAAIVILNYNGRNFLEKFLPNILQHSKPYPVIIADNASTDDSISFLEAHYPHLQKILLTENHGYAGGYNQALKQLDFQYYVLLNSDIEVTENWVDPIIQLMDADPQIAACQPKIKSYHKPEYFEYAGAAGGFIDFMGYPFCRGRIFSELEKDEGQYDSTIEVFWASGACLFVRATDFNEVGAFDEQFFAHQEEIDLCWRLRKANKKIICCAESSVYHVGGGTLQSESPFKIYLNFRNNWLLLYKNLSAIEFECIKSKRLLLDYLAALQYFLSGKIKNARAIFQAHTAYKKLKAGYQPSSTSGLKDRCIYRNSILRSFFLERIKKFSLLKGFNS